MRDINDIRKDINDIDKEMASLFEKRMEACREIALYKKANNLPIFDNSREREVIENNSTFVNNSEIRGFYTDFIKSNIGLSKAYQEKIIKGNSLGYDIVFRRGAIDNIERFINLKGKVLVISDDNVSALYANYITDKCANAYVYNIKPGEDSKNIDVYKQIIDFLIEKNFTRTDTIIALGGGVVGDISGFVASTYMRGLDFYYVPTSLLAQVDASIGGKNAIDYNGIKNLVGTIRQPKKVIIDPNVLKTLDKRELNAGLVESIKMALCLNKDLFDLIKDSIDINKDIDTIILESIKLKKKIVEDDIDDKDVRRVLNFGHTFGHAIEASGKGFLHGEAVGIGMLYCVSPKIKDKIRFILKKYDLPSESGLKVSELIDTIKHDKKASGQYINLVFVNEIGKYEFKRVKFEELLKYRED